HFFEGFTVTGDEFPDIALYASPVDRAPDHDGIVPGDRGDLFQPGHTRRRARASGRPPAGRRALRGRAGPGCVRDGYAAVHGASLRESAPPDTKILSRDPGVAGPEEENPCIP